MNDITGFEVIFEQHPFSKHMNKIFNLSDYFILSSAALSLIASVVIWFSGYREEGLFIGLWVPSIVAFGVYFKISVIYARRL